MTVEEYIVNRIKSSSELTALVSDRITPVRVADESQLPAITFLRISGGTVKSHKGSGMKTPRYQISAWGRTQLECSKIRDLITDVFDCVRSGSNVSFHETDNEIYDPTAKWYHMPVDILIHFNEL